MPLRRGHRHLPQCKSKRRVAKHTKSKEDADPPESDKEWMDWVMCMQMNKGEKTFYLRNHGLRCPFCRSEEHTVTAVGNLEVDGSTGTQTVKCTNCKKAWVDIYELIDTTEEK